MDDRDGTTMGGVSGRGVIHTSRLPDILKRGWKPAARSGAGTWVHPTAACSAGLPSVGILAWQFTWERRGTRAPKWVAKFIAPSGAIASVAGEVGGATRVEAAARLLMMAMARIGEATKPAP